MSRASPADKPPSCDDRDALAPYRAKVEVYAGRWVINAADGCDKTDALQSELIALGAQPHIARMAAAAFVWAPRCEDGGLLCTDIDTSRASSLLATWRASKLYQRVAA